MSYVHTLKTGFRIGEKTYPIIEISALTAGDAIDATQAGEVVRFAPDGSPVIVESPVIVSAERYRRQIKRLSTENGEELQGPVQLKDLRALSEAEYRELIATCDAIDELLLQKEAGDRKAGGRDEAEAGSNPDRA
ncbi:hypothetical protein [Thalassospira sp. MCCC 1A01428]|uniref:hypothetical protein n=1 Tax=Thalassospira sp. MCCC 1A01428 TaxID=1470575 RepID=UPI000A1E64AE|nr:hypothetical protein [Thalassospira sp. MCCC 1A01428]OSQ41671.1 hypothetical protein THS27_18350 [Thalassospira sp. MCCC 1A01428]